MSVIDNVLKREITICLVLFLPVLTALAQQEPSFAHYWAMEPSFNPAAAGKESKLNVTGAYAMTLTGFENAPKTMNIGADMPLMLLNAYHGVGVQLMNDQIGLFTHQRLALQYAYKHRMFGGMLSVGLQVGMLSEKFRGSEADLETPDDPAFTKTDASGTGLDLSAGLYYTHRNWYAGLSVLRATAPAIELGDRSILNISRMYYLTGGYNIKLRNPFFTIHPSVLAHTDGTVYRVDVTTRVKYTHDKKMLYAGLAYSPTNSVTALVGGNFHGVTLGYSYEVYTKALKIGNGSHELFVGYQMELDLSKKGRNRHQSVRIL
ncbi:MAG: type IX secretion system membrane protein PorP/SprF [Prevotella sp.]|nr:type IX secretion system membrane protein PorP/SprF [Prevotella sp.]MBQ6405415.1 type IX secretion system membrane protein PorP/SprF [Prevotella sp.]